MGWRIGEEGWGGEVGRRDGIERWGGEVWTGTCSFIAWCVSTL